MKYVILKIDLGQGVYKAFPYIFSEHDTHSVVAEYAKRLLMREMRKEATVHSAGFCGFGGAGIVCERGSETLKIAKEPHDAPGSIEDTRLLAFHDSTSGVMYG